MFWLFEEFGPKFKYVPEPENVVADALSRLDKEQSQSNGDTSYDNAAHCFATLDIDFLNPFRDDDKLHLAEMIFSSTHKENEAVFPVCAQRAIEAQQQDRDLLKWLRGNPGYSDTILEGTYLTTFREAYISVMLYNQVLWTGTTPCQDTQG